MTTTRSKPDNDDFYALARRNRTRRNQYDDMKRCIERAEDNNSNTHLTFLGLPSQEKQHGKQVALDPSDERLRLQWGYCTSIRTL